MESTDVLDTLEQAAPYVLAIIVALTALAHVLQAAAYAFRRWAITTPTPKDDEVAERIVRFVDRMTCVLDTLQAWLPQLGFGQRRYGVKRKR